MTAIKANRQNSMVRAAFRKRLAYSVMLDWGETVVKPFGYDKGVCEHFPS